MFKAEDGLRRTEDGGQRTEAFEFGRRNEWNSEVGKERRWEVGKVRR